MIKNSFVIPSYKDGESVIRLVKQLKKQKIRNSEIIVVESADKKYSKKLTKEIKFIFTKKKGRANQMNLGAEKAKGKLLIFLHADSNISKVHFNKRLEELPEDPWACFPIKFDSEKKYFRFIEFTSNIRKKHFHVPFGDQGLIVSKKVFKEVGGFPTEGFEDIEISKKLSRVETNPLTLQDPIISSQRRFEKHGIIKTHFIMALIVMSYVLHLKKLSAWFYNLIR